MMLLLMVSFVSQDPELRWVIYINKAIVIKRYCGKAVMLIS